jgi:O-antigen/teichoic acid export membrane protein
LFIGVNSVYKSILRVKGRIKELTIISGIIGAAVLLGSYFVMPTTGTVGIGYVWLAVQGLVAFYAIFAMRSSHKELLMLKPR